MAGSRDEMEGVWVEGAGSGKHLRRKGQVKEVPGAAGGAPGEV